ncbi:hypothetical protein JZ751_008082 [Albula glossodonta]|uniref:Uncharacterized protein n=1 Tax=Albula glossodonta TaxID=121402 RepID=A0A8T2PC28_9TELE|nr:hypothetical protein JZ751_008082 [Albula glossodonta]
MHFEYRPVGDSSPEAAKLDEAEGGEEAVVAFVGCWLFFEDFFSFIHGNSGAGGPLFAGGAGPCCAAVRRRRPFETRFWLLGRAWLLEQGFRLGMTCSLRWPRTT